MIPEIKQIKTQLTLLEQGLEEFMKKAEEVRNNNIQLNKELEELRAKLESYTNNSLGGS